VSKAATKTILHGAGLVSFNLREIKKGRLKTATRLALQGMGAVALDRVRRDVLKRDHTLEDLARLDHPYARRHGAIRVHPGEPHVVHTHSGRLAQSLDGKLVRRPGGAGGGVHYKFRIGFDSSPPSYVRHVILGTKIMLGRDVLGGAIYSPDMRKKLFKIAVVMFGRVMRTQAGLRFGGTR